MPPSTGESANGASSEGSRLAVAQGAYYAATGVWALVHLRSFEAVTGPKVDRWLVKTVGVLVTAIGGTLLAAGARGRVAEEVGLLAASSAAGLGAIDVYYAARGRISRVYLADAVVEAALVALWSVPLAARGLRARSRNAADSRAAAGSCAAADVAPAL